LYNFLYSSISGFPQKGERKRIDQRDSRRLGEKVKVSCDFPFDVQTSDGSPSTFKLIATIPVTFKLLLTSFWAFRLFETRVPLTFLILFIQLSHLFFVCTCCRPTLLISLCQERIVCTHFKYFFFYYSFTVLGLTVSLFVKLQPYWGGRTCRGRGGWKNGGLAGWCGGGEAEGRPLISFSWPFIWVSSLNICCFVFNYLFIYCLLFSTFFINKSDVIYLHMYVNVLGWYGDFSMVNFRFHHIVLFCIKPTLYCTVVRTSCP
jgi:hypothetical protein